MKSIREIINATEMNKDRPDVKALLKKNDPEVVVMAYECICLLAREYVTLYKRLQLTPEEKWLGTLGASLGQTNCSPAILDAMGSDFAPMSMKWRLLLASGEMKTARAARTNLLVSVLKDKQVLQCNHDLIRRYWEFDLANVELSPVWYAMVIGEQAKTVYNMLISGEELIAAAKKSAGEE